MSVKDFGMHTYLVNSNDCFIKLQTLRTFMDPTIVLSMFMLSFIDPTIVLFMFMLSVTFVVSCGLIER